MNPKKLEPKFKVGDVVHHMNNKQFTQIILSIGKTTYFVMSSSGIEDSLDFQYLEDTYKLLHKEVTITREKLAVAWDKSGACLGHKDHWLFENICKELGL